MYCVSSLCLFLLLGCGGNVKNAPASISGKVTYNGTPVGGGNIQFFTPNNESGLYNAAIKSDGTFAAGDLPVGEMVVTIETESINPNKAKAEYKKGGKQGGMSPVGSGTGQLNTGNYVKIPEKYKKSDTSGLKATLKPGKNTQNFELKD